MKEGTTGICSKRASRPADIQALCQDLPSIARNNKEIRVFVAVSGIDGTGEEKDP